MTGLTTETAQGQNGSWPVRERLRGWQAGLAGVGLTATLLLAGCSGGSDAGPTGTAASGGGTTGTAAAADTSGLTGTGWKLSGLLADGAPTAVDPTLNGWVRFAAAPDGLQVAFNTTCNQGGTSATVAGDQITFGPPRATLIYCDGPSGSTETAMLALFSGPRSFRLDRAAGTLTVTATDGTAGLAFTADPTVGVDAFADGPGSSAAAPTSSSS